jgi:hypothetical protein
MAVGLRGAWIGGAMGRTWIGAKARQVSIRNLQLATRIALPSDCVIGTAPHNSLIGWPFRGEMVVIGRRPAGRAAARDLTQSNHCVVVGVGSGSGDAWWRALPSADVISAEGARNSPYACRYQLKPGLCRPDETQLARVTTLPSSCWHLEGKTRGQPATVDL